MKKWFVAVIFLSILSLACKPKRTTAIRDFNDSLQPYLVKVVENGIVGYDDDTEHVQEYSTDEELKKLAHSEHPILRALAYQAILNRPSMDGFKMLMDHLDDTAMVTTDEGEWGEGYKMVSDVIIEHNQWKTVIEKKQAIDAVITKHNYLSSAYYISAKIEPDEKYYPSIRLMAERDGRHFRELECALLGLAKFKKAGDVLMLKEKLLANDWRMGDKSFVLLTDLPHDEYIEVLQEYFKHPFRMALSNNRQQASEFVKCAATYSDARTAAMLDTIYTSKQLFPCPADRRWLQQDLVYAIWNNKSDAFAALRKKVEPLYRKYERTKIELPMEGGPVEIDKGLWLDRW